MGRTILHFSDAGDSLESCLTFSAVPDVSKLACVMRDSGHSEALTF